MRAGAVLLLLHCFSENAELVGLGEQDWWFRKEHRHAEFESQSSYLHLQYPDVIDSTVSHSLVKGFISAPLYFFFFF